MARMPRVREENALLVEVRDALRPFMETFEGMAGERVPAGHAPSARDIHIQNCRRLVEAYKALDTMATLGGADENRDVFDPATGLFTPGGR